MVLEGNHEIERDETNATFLAYLNRFRVPHMESGSPSPLFYSFDLAGKLTSTPWLPFHSDVSLLLAERLLRRHPRLQACGCVSCRPMCMQNGLRSGQRGSNSIAG